MLPVDYYLVTFTLPAQLRALVYANQREAYDLLIKLACLYRYSAQPALIIVPATNQSGE